MRRTAALITALVLGLPAAPAAAFPQTGLFYQPNSRVALSLFDGALQGAALLGGTIQPYQLLDLAARLPVPLADSPFELPLTVHGMVGYRQMSSDRGDTLRGLDLAVQGRYQLIERLALHASLGAAVMVHGDLAGASTGIMPQTLPRFDVGASYDLGTGVTAMAGFTVWTVPEPLLNGGVFPGELGWYPGLILGLNWAGPRL